VNQNNKRRALPQIRQRAYENEEASPDRLVRGLPTRAAFGNLLLAIELVQSGMTNLASIAEACHLPVDTVEEIAAAHKVNLSQAE